MTDPQPTRRRAEDGPQGWNEADFLHWDAFRRMAPAILQLEITRMGTLIDRSVRDTDFRNALVKARYATRAFVACLDRARQAPLPDACLAHLRTAMLSLPFGYAGTDAATTDTLAYMADRLHYVYRRAGLLF